MGSILWLALFVVANVLGVTALNAALTLPADERLLPAMLTIPLIGIAALGAARLSMTWRASRKDA